jgi:nitrate reductase alpha subunit
MKNTTVVNYKGKNYKIRTIKVRDKIAGEILESEIKIAPIALNEAYDDKGMSVHGSKEQKLDASIDHYVTNELMESVPEVITDRDIAEVMMDIVGCSEEMEVEVA